MSNSYYLDVSDVELVFNPRIGLDIIFDLGHDTRVDVGDSLGNDVGDNLGNTVNTPIIGSFYGFNPSEGDYYVIVDGVATLVKVAPVVNLTDADGHQLFDSDGNPLTSTL